MCDNRDGKFVVPVKPAAARGWWVGQVICEGGVAHKLNGVEVTSCTVNLLWIEDPARSLSNITSVLKCDIVEFDTVKEAMENLRSKGAPV